MLAYGLHPLESDAGRLGADETGRKCAGLCLEQRGEGLRRTPGRRPIWLAAEEGLAMAQCADTAAGRLRFVEHLDNRAREEGVRAGVIEPGEDRRHSHLRHGWYWGSQAFAERMLQLAGKGIGTFGPALVGLASFLTPEADIILTRTVGQLPTPPTRRLAGICTQQSGAIVK